MADNHSRNSRARTTQADPSYDVYDEDPLVELARIVSEDGGYFNISEHPEPEAEPDPELDIGYADEEMDLGIDLEGQIMEELELSMASPDGDFQEPDNTPRPAARYHNHAYAPEDSAALSQMTAGPVEQSVEYDSEFEADDWPEDLPEQDDGYAGGVQAGMSPQQHVGSDGVISVEDLSDLEQALSELDENPSYEGGINGQFADDVEYDTDWPDDDTADADIGVAPFVPAGDGYAGHHVPHEGRSGRKVFAVAAVLSIAVLGGGVVAMMNSTSNTSLEGAPPVFKADASPVKVAPDAKDDAGSEDAVFDVADGPVKEELVDRTETPVRQIIPAEGTQQAEVLRPVGDESSKNDARLSENSTSAATDSPRFDPIGPKQVRTVKVGADGTIIRPSLDDSAVVSNNVDSEIVGGLPTPVDVSVNESATAEPQPVPVKVVDIKSGTVGSDALSVVEPKPSPLETVIAGLPADETPLENNAATESGDAAADAGIPLPRERPANAPQAVARAAPALVAQPAQQNAAPVNLLEAARTPAARQVAPTPVSTGSTGSDSTNSGSTGSGSHLVQLSSQRTEEQARAAFNGLKVRYPSLLGNYDPNIQRADLGDRGVYYRVRVGPMSDQTAAVQFCEQLKSSGGSCFVTR